MTAGLLAVATATVGVASGVEPPPGLSPGGLASPGVEWVANVPLGEYAVGGRLVGDVFLATAAGRGLVALDASDPLRPRVLDDLVLPHSLENEDLATNGRTALLSVGGPVALAEHVSRSATGGAAREAAGALVVVDVSDPDDLRVTDVVEGAADHVVTCLLDCSWAYTQGGKIISLEGPAGPVLHEQDWAELVRAQDPTLGGGFPGHALTEVRPGLVLTASEPSVLLDVRDPLSPKLLGRSPAGEVGTYHNVSWPQGGASRWVLAVNEPAPVQGPSSCTVREEGRRNASQVDVEGVVDGDSLRAQFESALTVYDARGWREPERFRALDRWYPADGVVLDGARPVSARGCGAHWFDVHPQFGGGGGLVAEAAYDHGTRLLEVGPSGRIVERGWFLPHGGSASASYWIDRTTVWTVDLERGIDVLRIDPAGLQQSTARGR